MSLHTETPDHVRIICIPSDAGAHLPGPSKAPAAILSVGQLASKLSSGGYEFTTHDQVIFSDFLRNAASWTPTAKIKNVRNEDNAYAVLTAIEKDLANNHAAYQSSFPIVLGGDSSIMPAIISGLRQWHSSSTRIGLIYFDGDVALALPSQSDVEGSSGTLDSMTLTHLFGRPGSLASMRQFTHSDEDNIPLLSSANTVLFGLDPLLPAPEHWTYLLENGCKAFARQTVQSDPLGCAQRALTWLDTQHVDVIYVHFSPNVCDSGQFPLGSYPHYSGLDVDKAFGALEEFLCCKKVRGLTLTGVNPDRDIDGKFINQLVDSVVTGLKMKKAEDEPGDFKLGRGPTF